MASSTLTATNYASNGMGDANGDGGLSAPFRENLNSILICPDCQEQPPNLVEEFSSGDMVCGSCGLVLGDRIIDTRSEWRTFANDDQGNDDPSRVGDSFNPLLNGSQLETSVGNGDSHRARELQRAQQRSTADKSSKGLLAAYREISTFCDLLNLPKTVTDGTKHIFKLAEEARVFKGKSQDAVIAGCIFVACRQFKCGRTFREIHALTHVSKKEIGRNFKILESFLQNQKNKNSTGSFLQVGNFENTTSTTADELCARYCSNLGFRNAHQMEKISRALAERSSSVKDLAGRSPLSVAAACIYMASHLMGDPKASKEIATVAGVSDGTIKTAYKFLYNTREQLIDPTWLAPQGTGSMDRLPVN